MITQYDYTIKQPDTIRTTTTTDGRITCENHISPPICNSLTRSTYSFASSLLIIYLILKKNFNKMKRKKKFHTVSQQETPAYRTNCLTQFLFDKMGENMILPVTLLIALLVRWTVSLGPYSGKPIYKYKG
jgi:hypothetical protein